MTLTRDQVVRAGTYAWSGRYHFRHGHFIYEGCGCGGHRERPVALTAAPRGGWQHCSGCDCQFCHLAPDTA